MKLLILGNKQGTTMPSDYSNTYRTTYTTLLTFNKWSEEARKAALEARKRKKKSQRDDEQSGKESETGKKIEGAFGEAAKASTAPFTYGAVRGYRGAPTGSGKFRRTMRALGHGVMSKVAPRLYGAYHGWTRNQLEIYNMLISSDPLLNWNPLEDRGRQYGESPSTFTRLRRNLTEDAGKAISKGMTATSSGIKSGVKAIKAAPKVASDALDSGAKKIRKWTSQSGAVD